MEMNNMLLNNKYVKKWKAKNLGEDDATVFSMSQ